MCESRSIVDMIEFAKTQPMPKKLSEVPPYKSYKTNSGRHLQIRYISGLNINTASGGKFNTNDNACPWLGVSSATAPPLLP